MTTPLLEARSIAKVYDMHRGLFAKATGIRAVDDVSLRLERGDTLGIVGESGSGKSTTGRVVLGLEPASSGEVLFEGKTMAPSASPDWRRLRMRMQMIYQDPLGALDRRLPVAAQVREPLDIHGLGTIAERDARVSELLQAVGLSAGVTKRFPHELSGGQRQRVVLARALVSKPDLLVCDEPVSALDVSIQAQVVNLLSDLQAELGLTMVFISHDLRVVRQISRRIAVMYLGRIVEEGDADDLFVRPEHPYTRALVSAAPIPGRRMADRDMLQGEPPNPAQRPSGCSFHPRCPLAIARCRTDVPSLLSLGGNRLVACHVAAGSSPARSGASASGTAPAHAVEGLSP
ncbi:ABC transporter ATP-binding protein [Affinirhizobium pseudoryzae]|uniref:ABC transporter ATP-binding protein n=1 Tax=Allorhizobium pseudoryzae TaxID=379684 RepID=UPI0013E9B0EB|nr:ABC transporter ATP-binding protein [Allorhizobium pseudoryzae]